MPKKNKSQEKKKAIKRIEKFLKNPTKLSELREKISEEVLNAIIEDKEVKEKIRGIATSLLLGEGVNTLNEAPLEKYAFYRSDRDVEILDGEFGHYTLFNQLGTATISDGNFGSYTLSHQSGTVSISDGNFGDYTLSNQSGTATISDGNFGDYTLFNQSDTVSISGGEFKDLTLSVQSGIVSISGGEFRDLTLSGQSGTATISDGNFGDGTLSYQSGIAVIDPIDPKNEFSIGDYAFAGQRGFIFANCELGIVGEPRYEVQRGAIIAKSINKLYNKNALVITAGTKELYRRIEENKSDNRIIVAGDEAEEYIEALGRYVLGEEKGTGVTIDGEEVKTYRKLDERYNNDSMKQLMNLGKKTGLIDASELEGDKGESLYNKILELYGDWVFM